MDASSFIWPSVGGLLIGASVSAHWILNGRQAGISGMLGGLLEPKSDDARLGLIFLAGLVTGGVVLGRVFPVLFAWESASSYALLAVGGVLVGFGTRLGGGCTSGHGLCGIGRGSKRSIAATLLFMAAGAVSVFVVRHLIGGPA
jgi:uncharacterized membrane protein YedE/YeeE